MKTSYGSNGAALRLGEPKSRPLYFLMSHLKRALMMVNCLSLQIRSYQMPGRSEKERQNLVYIGNLENIDWLERSLLEKCSLCRTAEIPFWKCAREIKQQAADQVVTVVDINRILARFLPPGGFLSYPWIQQVISLDSAEFRKRRYNLMGEFRRLMRKHEYTTGISSDPKDIDYFYDRLYLPFVKYRFESLAHPRSRSEIIKAVKNGFILQVFHKGEWIAGDIVRINGKELQGIASGLLPDYETPPRQTARTVMYPILFEWAAAKGYRRINLLRSRANKRDGVFVSKQHRGAVAEVDSWPHTVFKFYIAEDSAIPELLRSQLVEQKGKLIPLEEARKNWP